MRKTEETYKFFNMKANSDVIWLSLKFKSDFKLLVRKNRSKRNTKNRVRETENERVIQIDEGKGQEKDRTRKRHREKLLQKVISILEILVTYNNTLY